MSNKEWKEGFEAGISFALTMINEQCDAEFEGVGNVIAEIKHLREVVKIFEKHTNVEVSK
jgi:hypothetical protein